MMPECIFLDSVSKNFDDGSAKKVAALNELTLKVGDGTFLALLGPSGCGKTTVMRLLDGLIQPDAGSVHIFGKPPKPGPDIGFVFQSFRLVPWANVAQNVDFALQGVGLDAVERAERVRSNLELVGLSRVAGTYPAALSGGMK